MERDIMEGIMCRVEGMEGGIIMRIVGGLVVGGTEAGIMRRVVGSRVVGSRVVAGMGGRVVVVEVEVEEGEGVK